MDPGKVAVIRCHFRFLYTAVQCMLHTLIIIIIIICVHQDTRARLHVVLCHVRWNHSYSFHMILNDMLIKRTGTDNDMHIRYL